MHLLDISDDVLMDILSLVDPVDLVNIYNVCARLRPLAERIINKVVLRLNLTGINSFPHLKHGPKHNFDRIRVNRNWLKGKFRKQTLLTDKTHIWKGIVVDDEHLYAVKEGSIRKYDRLWNGEYLSSEFKLVGKKEDHNIFSFAKKDNVIFAANYDRSFMIFVDEKPAMERSSVFHGGFAFLELYPKNNIYVGGSSESVLIFNRSPEYGPLQVVDEISQWSDCLKIDPSGENVITASHDYVSLYNFNTKNITDFVELDDARDLLWKDLHTVLSGHLDGSLRVFDLRTRSVCQRIDPLKKDYNKTILFDGHNTVLCGFFSSGTVSICDLRMNKVIKEINIFNEEELKECLVQIAADQKHLFVVTNKKLDVCDFSII